ncbi:MAG: PD-(D/E)XK nuclease family protein [Cytophagales bacterium]|nr:PD-(D/E)XK nuclease family protein [Cytophagales bacterium]
MSTFLGDLAQEVIKKHQGHFNELTLVFPNRRAGLFFRRELAQRISQPIWSPRIVSIDDFIKSLSSLKNAHKLKLLFELYEVYSSMAGKKESFDRFYYWGEMLLKDFEDIDKYGGEAAKIFEHLKDQKEIEEAFEYLTEEQVKLIQTFWASFRGSISSHQQEFIDTWRILAKVYSAFQTRLREEGIAYTGMIHQDVVRKIRAGEVDHSYQRLVFAGFNALTQTEETIISWFLEHVPSEMHWDADEYYFADAKQEAGNFLRMYRQHRVLGKTFPETFKNGFDPKFRKQISITGVAMEVGQTKLLGKQLQELQRRLEESGERLVPERTAIVIPNEGLLFPVLHALPESFQKLNVTMGYPLSKTSLYQFFEQLADLQLASRVNGFFHYRQVLALLKHPFLMHANYELASRLSREIVQENKHAVAADWLLREPCESFQLVFQRTESIEGFCAYLDSILRHFHEVFSNKELKDPTFEQEFVYYFYKELNRLAELVGDNSRLDVGLPTFIRLMKQIIRNLRIPFSGEPLNGLQVMGVLETRNLDFENVFILSMNEGSFPAAPSSHSFIPYNLRKGYGLPTFEQHDAIYSYLFYSLIQRAKNVHMLYNTSGNNGSGEMSRFLHQLLFEYNPKAEVKIERRVLSNSIQISEVKPLAVASSEYTRQKLRPFLSNEEPRTLTPSALNTFLDCRLKFYFRYAAGLQEPDILLEEVEARSFGNILHSTLEELYKQLMARKKSDEIAATDFEYLKKGVHAAIDSCFQKQFQLNPDQPVAYEGRNIIAREMIYEMALKILAIDAEYAPFRILGLEERIGLDYAFSQNGEKKQVRLGGYVDRIDMKDGVIRMIDYKSGKDNKVISEGIPKLFDRAEKKRNKAALQTLIYAMVYNQSRNSKKLPVRPGIFNSKEIFSKDFESELSIKQGRNQPVKVMDARSLEEELQENLNAVLAEMFSEPLFDQTENRDICAFCPYAEICQRN